MYIYLYHFILDKIVETDEDNKLYCYGCVLCLVLTIPPIFVCFVCLMLNDASTLVGH